MPTEKILKYGAFILTIVFALPTFASPSIRVKVPPYSSVEAEGVEIKGNLKKGKYKLNFPEDLIFPLKLKITGPFGGIIIKTISSPDELENIKIKTGIVESKSSNPKNISFLPKLCPRLKMDESPGQFYYDAESDRINRIPFMQMMDIDAGAEGQYKTYEEMDGKNVLLLLSARVTYDYEDSNIVDYEGPNPLTGERHVIHEGEGGFYANIHYAVVPYRRDILKMDRQTLLHLAQGKLRELDREDSRSILRTHSLIPGPFLSKANYLYHLCEWGDTAFQAPEQSLEYKNMAIWDWDYSVKNADHVLMIVWEGDEEDWLIQKKLIDPFYLTDDLIGVFKIKKRKTIEPLTLKNEKGDFEITVQTGNLSVPAK